MNIADQFFKEQEAGANLRRQIKDGLDENAGLKMEMSEAKREIFKLQNHKWSLIRPSQPARRGGRGGRPARGRSVCRRRA